MAIALLSSCTATKRKYFPGYYIESSGKKKSIPVEPDKALSVPYIPSIPSPDFTQPSDTLSLTCSIESVPIALKEDKPVVFNSNYSKTAYSKKKKTSKSQVQSQSDEGNEVAEFAKWFGIGLLIGGFALFWYVSILVGLFFMGIGLLFFIGGVIGSSTSHKGTQREENKSGEYQDVVYLKNGGIVRGVIIESIPNVSLKIETSDRSVFVFTYDEIIKITKERQ